jgi:hypothetical protein
MRPAVQQQDRRVFRIARDERTERQPVMLERFPTSRLRHVRHSRVM